MYSFPRDPQCQGYVLNPYRTSAIAPKPTPRTPKCTLMPPSALFLAVADADAALEAPVGVTLADPDAVVSSHPKRD